MKSKEEVTAVEGETKPALVPKLRFPEFRDAQVWEEATLSKFIRSLDAGVSVNAGDRPASKAELGVLKTSCVSNGVFDPNENKVVSNELEKARLTESVTANSIIISRMNTPALVGANSYIEENAENLFLPDRLWAAKPQDGVSMRFLAHILGSDAGRSALSNLAKGSSGSMKNITKPDVLALRVIAPSYCEQQKIADCLSSLDELIAAQARKVDVLKTHKKGLMQQLFPREGETQPRLRFPEFQNVEDWEESPLSKFILSLDAGVSVNSGDRPAGKTEFGVLKTSAVTSGIFEPNENKVVFKEGEQYRLKEAVRGGTIIISRMNTPSLVGANAYVESNYENIFLPDRLWAAKPRQGVSMRFLAFILGSAQGRTALSKLAKGSSGSMKNITKPEVLAFSVMAPSPAEQQRIASCLSSLDDLITAETQKLDTLKTHKKGLMQQLFPSPDEAAA